jgi:hypothetical protein
MTLSGVNLSVAGFENCSFHQRALAAAKAMHQAGLIASLDDRTFTTRDEYRQWLFSKDGRASFGEAAAKHSSSPFVWSSAPITFVGGCDATLELAVKLQKASELAAEHDGHAFQEKFLSLVADYDRSRSPMESSDELRRVIRSSLLRFTDMRENPHLFFLAHRLLATRMLGGFGIRFTVQYNLFAGSILGLGSEEQLGMLDRMQGAGELGCFALTEVDAGVMSGLIVETTATWNTNQQTFRINTPHPGARKNWISQVII